MEKRHRRTYLDRVNPVTGVLWDDVLAALLEQLDASPRAWLLFCQHSTIASAVAKSLWETAWNSWLITGGSTHKQAEEIKQGFLRTNLWKRVLIGTSTLATGVDGLDKACDQLMIFDDIDGDHSKRRQLIGRVLPRGLDTRTTRVSFARTKEY